MALRAYAQNDQTQPPTPAKVDFSYARAAVAPSRWAVNAQPELFKCPIYGPASCAFNSASSPCVLLTEALPNEKIAAGET